ncbi:MAG TPA: hypothetical protein DDY98_07600 [Ruminococcaceae bacterium]|nr:hypothetical protein [Oscillospiraceae bacterium]
MFVSVFVFTIAMTVVFVACGSVPDALIVGFFGWFGVEGGALALIKNCDTRHKNKKRKVEKDEN